MALNGCSSFDDAGMAERDGEKVVTMMDVLQEQQDFEEDANAVLGASDEKNCTYSKGYVKRQALYACLTCCTDLRNDPEMRAGVCLACSLACHENHELVELYTKRNFRCDCGNAKFNSHPCQFTPIKTGLNDENKYNQNFSGLYCVCNRPYPDPEAPEEDEMIQCIICEDWLHASHLEATVPPSDAYSEMICKACMVKNEFLHNYTSYAVNTEDIEIDIADASTNGIELNESKLNNVNGEKSETDGTQDIENKKDDVEKVTETSESIVESSVTDGSEQVNTLDNGEITEDSSIDNTNDTEKLLETPDENKDKEMDSVVPDSTADGDNESNLLTESSSTKQETEVLNAQTTEGDMSPIPEVTKDNTNKNEPIEPNNLSNVSDGLASDIQDNKESKDIISNDSTENTEKENTSKENQEIPDTVEADTTSIDESHEISPIITNDKDNVGSKTTINDTEKPESKSYDTDIIQSTNDIEMDEGTKENKENDVTLEAKTVNENKRKMSTEEEKEDHSGKKPKLGSDCIKPEEKNVYKGATFWPSTFRQKLCTCSECLAMYKDLSVLFLIDPDDTVTAYETLGKERINGNPVSQYEKGLEALSSLDRIQQINALTEYNRMRDKLLVFLKSFKERKEVVREEDIKEFFAGMKPKREPDGVYFCR